MDRRTRLIETRSQLRHAQATYDYIKALTEQRTTDAAGGARQPGTNTEDRALMMGIIRKHTPICAASRKRSIGS